MPEILKDTSSVGEFWLEPTGKTIEPVEISAADLSGRIMHSSPYENHSEFELRLSATSHRSVIVDFGREVGGYPRVTFASGGCRRVGFQAAESLEHLMSPLVVEAASLVDPTIHYAHCRAISKAQVELPHCGGFRYLWIYPERRGKVGLRGVTVGYTPHASEMDESGYFLCSDEELNRIWYAGLHTLEVCTIEPRLGGADSKHRIAHADWVIVDGARRDRLVWTADLAPASAAAYASSNVTGAVRDSLTSLADYQEKSGYIPACSPGPLPARLAGALFADYVAWWVIILYQYYLHTGDTDCVREYFPAVKRALSYLHEQCRGGLFRQTPMNMWEWCFTVLRRGKPSYTNVMYYWALNGASSMAHEIGQEEASIGFVSRAFRLGESIQRELTDPHKAVLVDTTSDRSRVPQDANSLAIVSGLTGEEAAMRTTLDYMRENLWVGWGSTNVDVPYYRLTPWLGPHNKRVIPFMNYFEAAARFTARDDGGAVELVRRCWGGMLERDGGSTYWEWEGSDGSVDGHLTSLCHSWSSGVLALLTSYVLGVRPLSPGYASYIFDPRDVGLDWAEGRVPVPGGFIEARVERKKDGGLTRKIKAPRGIIELGS